jgi:hypothetical protein
MALTNPGPTSECRGTVVARRPSCERSRSRSFFVGILECDRRSQLVVDGCTKAQRNPAKFGTRDVVAQRPDRICRRRTTVSNVTASSRTKPVTMKIVPVE